MVRTTPERQRQKQDKFLKAFALMGNITKSCQAANVSRRAHYKWLKSCPEYKQRFEDGRKEVIDRLEAEAWRRAVDGNKKPVSIAGKREIIREYSDVLLIFLLKANKPEKYRDNYRHIHEGTLVVDSSVRQQAIKDSHVRELLTNLAGRIGGPTGSNGHTASATAGIDGT